MWCWGRVKCAAAKAIWQAKGACAIENAVLVGCACGGVCKTRITCITRKTRISSIHAGCRVKMPRKPHKYSLPRFSLPCFSLSCFGKPKQAQCSYVLERAKGGQPYTFLTHCSRSVFSEKITGSQSKKWEPKVGTVPTLGRSDRSMWRLSLVSSNHFSDLDCMAVALPCLACRLFLGMTATAP